MIILPDMLGVKTPMYIGVKKFIALSVPSPLPGERNNIETEINKYISRERKNLKQIYRRQALADICSCPWLSDGCVIQKQQHCLSAASLLLFLNAFNRQVIF